MKNRVNYWAVFIGIISILTGLSCLLERIIRTRIDFDYIFKSIIFSNHLSTFVTFGAIGLLFIYFSFGSFGTRKKYNWSFNKGKNGEKNGELKEDSRTEEKGTKDSSPVQNKK